MGNMLLAKEYYERALDIRIKKLGPEHADVATTYNNLSVPQHDMDKSIMNVLWTLD